MKLMQDRPYSALSGTWYAYHRAPLVHANITYRDDVGQYYCSWVSYVVYPQPELIDVDVVACRGYN